MPASCPARCSRCRLGGGAGRDAAACSAGRGGAGVRGARGAGPPGARGRPPAPPAARAAEVLQLLARHAACAPFQPPDLRRPRRWPSRPPAAPASSTSGPPGARHAAPRCRCCCSCADFYGDRLALQLVNFKERAVTVQRYMQDSDWTHAGAAGCAGEGAAGLGSEDLSHHRRLRRPGRARWRVRGEFDWSCAEAGRLVESLWRRCAAIIPHMSTRRHFLHAAAAAGAWPCRSPPGAGAPLRPAARRLAHLRGHHAGRPGAGPGRVPGLGADPLGRTPTGSTRWKAASPPTAGPSAWPTAWKARACCMWHSTPPNSQPFVELTTRVQTRDRAVDWSSPAPVREDAAALAHCAAADGADPHRRHRARHRAARPSAMRAPTPTRSAASTTGSWPTPGASRRCAAAARATSGPCWRPATWAASAPTSTRCSWACAASAGVPARDVYGLRLAPSAFGYRELGSNPANLKAAQHCRAEVFLQAHGWVAMDPADVSQGDAAGNGRVDQGRAPSGGRAGVPRPLRRLGRQLGRLQHRARRGAARLQAGASWAS